MLTDQELVIRTLKGDHQAFAELVERHQGVVYNVCYRMLGDRFEAEDAVQETFLRAYRHLRGYDQERPFKTWLLSIASNHCIDRLRRRRFTKLSIEELLPSHPALASREIGPEEAAVRNERSDSFQGMLEELSPKYRAVVVLHYWYDMSCKEIADVLGTQEGTVKSRLFRARQQLATQAAARAAHLDLRVPAHGTLALMGGI
ncbi:MAG TPA: sigma-70 family RNA polymerase sigma factor [Aggregatilineales bacterium]|nr:sigma-70 family RNA polymerase sigma factor [Chloroflexota bacterium]HOA23809.1 sigma-70 family RNA polymerase sigma factor [Aggregatilineales bacterium]HPV06422.1 sigma-70 family RNA polymerase sigma factor [Aggregatilineales bacterium]HQA68063.1 sigma-70 family RNA polymerase sigma factor [Aggregatilineales bacterium]